MLQAEIKKINYCEVKEECTVGCIWGVTNEVCGTPYFYNKQESNEIVEFYRSKLSDLIIKKEKDTYQINCLLDPCQFTEEKKLYRCENNVCKKNDKK